jgi:hypothetical protein
VLVEVSTQMLLVRVWGSGEDAVNEGDPKGVLEFFGSSEPDLFTSANELGALLRVAREERKAEPRPQAGLVS